MRFPPFMLAAIGMAPALFVEVYLGHVAKHASKAAAGISSHSPRHLSITVAGLLICVVLTISIGRMAQRALSEAEAEGEAEIGRDR